MWSTGHFVRKTNKIWSTGHFVWKTNKMWSTGHFVRKTNKIWSTGHFVRKNETKFSGILRYKRINQSQSDLVLINKKNFFI